MRLERGARHQRSEIRHAHRGSSSAKAIDETETALGELRVRSGATQLERLLKWAVRFPERTFAVEGAGGLGYLLAHQLVSAGERVLDVQPKLASRVRLLATGDTNKNDPNDARSVAIAALRSPAVRVVRPEDHAQVMKVWSKRHRNLASTRTQVACRLHAVLASSLRAVCRASSMPHALPNCSKNSIPTVPSRQLGMPSISSRTSTASTSR